MALTQDQLVAACTRRTKTQNDATAIEGFKADIDIGIQIISGIREWNELKKTGTLSLALADGDKNYVLSVNAQNIRHVRITSPTNYAKVLRFWNDFDFYNYVPQKTLFSPAPPNAWYFVEPQTSGSTGAVTKRISFDQMPDRSYTVTYLYESVAPALTSSSYPFFPKEFHHILIDYALWKYAERETDESLNPNYFKANWDEGLVLLLDNYKPQQREMVPIAGPEMYG